ncbi:MAG: hypothetical protein M1838_000253 [Thelocarpon superellum]|nr:MAG: hypothetical protein M1838_000253 [Thelocarpon superellum]
MASADAWEKTKSTSKKGFDKVWQSLDVLGKPVNKLSNKLGAEAFWPTTLDKESDKAARILKSFCKDGFYDDKDKLEHSNKALKRIPQAVSSSSRPKIKTDENEVIARAKGLAVFTTMRTGLWISGSGGSGVLVARLPDGSWSPPSGILIHTLGLGFLAGIDIYDCVLVINSETALDAFTKVRCTVGGEVSAVAGPVGVGGILDSEVHKRQQPVFSYLKSRGLYAGVQIDGTVVIERADENERFYGEKIKALDILKGKVRHPPWEIETLLETIKVMQGDSDVLPGRLLSEPTPGDMELDHSGANGEKPFGIPDVDDPDPFGVRALEKEGLAIREAGSRSRPSSDQFEFRPSPTSPIFNTFNRQSMESARRKSRQSLGRLSVDRGIQTEEIPAMVKVAPEPEQSVPNGVHDEPEQEHDEVDKQYESISLQDNTADTSHPRSHPHSHPHPPHSDPQSHLGPPPAEIKEEEEFENPTENENESENVNENVNVVTVAAQKPTLISKARLVTIPKRIPPALPPRSPARSRRDGLARGDERDSPSVSPRSSSLLSPSPLSVPLTEEEGPHHFSNGTDEEKEKG